jgi:hypothetical protein
LRKRKFSGEITVSLIPSILSAKYETQFIHIPVNTGFEARSIQVYKNRRNLTLVYDLYTPVSK